MKSGLNQKGKYYQLPIIGHRINKLIFNGMIQIEFGNNEVSRTLDIHGEFQLIGFGKQTQYDPRDKNSWKELIDLWQEEVDEALADRTGNLVIQLNNKIELKVEDGTYENWHFTLIDHQNKNNNLFVHGGVGKTIW